ncbi:kinase-like domain-containing protein [Xylaria castorea]|nr:kinase-like domain-containing protein [Xylaria castorea]
MPLDLQFSHDFPEGRISQGHSGYLDLILQPTPVNPVANSNHTSLTLAQALEYSITNNEQDGTSDWNNLRLQPVLSQHGSTRILMRPRIEGVRIGPYETGRPFGHWADVEMEGDKKPVAVLVVEPDHVHIGCVVSYNDTQCHLFFDPGYDHIYVRNCSSHPLSTKQLDSNNSYRVLPNEKAILHVGVWTLDTDSKSLIEIQVLERKAWITTQPLSSKRGAPIDEDSSKRLRLSNDIATAKKREVVIARDPRADNALIELKKGEKIYVGVSKVYWLKRLDTIFDHQNSSVWQAEHKKWDDGRKIVVKVIKPEAFRGDVIKTAEAWKRECEAHVAVTKNRHPAIVQILGFDARFHSIYTEYIAATSLADHRCPGLSYAGSRIDAQRIMHDIASALYHVHSQNKVHNDIKPGNILYSQERGAVLIDFGISFSQGHPKPAGGTPWYLPPEFMLNWKLRGPASDIWALGVVMLWVLGHIPFPDGSCKEWRVSHIHPKTPGSPSHQDALDSMSRWIKYIQQARLKLRQEDEMEFIVSQTLETEIGARIDAESLCKQLSSLGSTAP